MRLLLLLTTAAVAVGLDKADFSATFKQDVDNVLGIKKFEVINHICCHFVILFNALVSRSFWCSDVNDVLQLTMH